MSGKSRIENKKTNEKQRYSWASGRAGFWQSVSLSAVEAACGRRRRLRGKS